MPDESSKLLERLTAAGVIANPGRWSVEPASGGLNTQVYFVMAPDETGFAVRLGRSGNNLRREAEILDSLTSCPGVPAPIYYEDDILVHPALPGESAPIENATGRQIEALGRTLACIHSQHHAYYVIWPDFTPRNGSRLDLLKGRIASLDRYRAFREATLPELIALQREVTGLDLHGDSWEETHFSWIHGDLSVGNILWADDAVYLVDWEYSRSSDPAEELAYLATEQSMSDEQLEALRAGYEESGAAPDTWERVETWAPLTALDSAFWWCDYLLERDEEPRSHPEVETRIEMVRRWLDR